MINANCNHSAVDTAFLNRSVDLFGWVVRHGLVVDFDDDGGCGKSLYRRRSMLRDKAI